MPLVRLVTFPPAGAGAGWFGSWRRALPDWVELWSVCLPGRESRLSEHSLRSLREIVDGVTPALRLLQDVPVALLGHSMGAMVSWESARTLAAAGDPLPIHLFVSSHRAPVLPRSEGGEFALDDRALVEVVEQRYGGFPQRIVEYPEVLEMALTALRADLEALERHTVVPAAPLPIATTVLGATNDPAVPVEDLAPWSVETSGSFVIRTFEGDHRYLAAAPPDAVGVVVQRLRNTLGSASTRASVRPSPKLT